MASSTDLRLDELCRVAAAAAAGKGHDLRDWTTDRTAAEPARRTTCRRCGRPLYVRVGDGMTGIAGAALTTPCV